MDTIESPALAMCQASQSSCVSVAAFVGGGTLYAETREVTLMRRTSIWKVYIFMFATEKEEERERKERIERMLIKEFLWLNWQSAKPGK